MFPLLNWFSRFLWVTFTDALYTQFFLFLSCLSFRIHKSIQHEEVKVRWARFSFIPWDIKAILQTEDSGTHEDTDRKTEKEEPCQPFSLKTLSWKEVETTTNKERKVYDMKKCSDINHTFACPLTWVCSSSFASLVFLVLSHLLRKILFSENSFVFLPPTFVCYHR
jgi:hypothetical protein